MSATVSAPLEVECGLLPNPVGGGVTQDGVTFGSQATYFCGDEFTLIGDMIRICQANGQWSGSQPICQRIRKGAMSTIVYTDLTIACNLTIV